MGAAKDRGVAIRYALNSSLSAISLERNLTWNDTKLYVGEHLIEKHPALKKTMGPLQRFVRV